MATSRTFVLKVSPRASRNISNTRINVNVDTPNKRNILNNNLSIQGYPVLGRGRFGKVYKAFYKGNEVAAKLIQSNKETVNSEKRASYLRHSNIVRILNVDQGDKLSLVTMELCGESLQNRLEERTLESFERIHIFSSIGEALKFCHSAGIIHGDVKPKNILLDSKGNPKLTDFGSSVTTKEQANRIQIYGTPGYVAPEVIKGNLLSPASDVYSLGIVAWQLISRTLPFRGLHAHTILYLTGKGMRPNDQHLQDGFDGRYKCLYRSMWTQNNKERPGLKEIINVLDTFLV